MEIGLGYKVQKQKGISILVAALDQSSQTPCTAAEEDLILNTTAAAGQASQKLRAVARRAAETENRPYRNRKHCDDVFFWVA